MSSRGMLSQIWHIADPSKFKAGAATLTVGFLCVVLLYFNIVSSTGSDFVPTAFGLTPDGKKMEKSVAYSFAITGKKRQLV